MGALVLLLYPGLPAALLVAVYRACPAGDCGPNANTVDTVATEQAPVAVTA